MGSFSLWHWLIVLVMVGVPALIVARIKSKIVTVPRVIIVALAALFASIVFLSHKAEKSSEERFAEFERVMRQAREVSFEDSSDAIERDVKGQVAADAVEQYFIAERQGDPIQICVQAGLVSAAYLQALDEEKYRSWKRIEDLRCKAAGVKE